MIRYDTLFMWFQGSNLGFMQAGQTLCQLDYRPTPTLWDLISVYKESSDESLCKPRRSVRVPVYSAILCCRHSHTTVHTLGCESAMSLSHMLTHLTVKTHCGVQEIITPIQRKTRPYGEVKRVSQGL